LAHDFEPLSYNQRKTVKNPDFIVMGDQNVDWPSIVKYQLGNQP
jgi:3'(2'), 5'-bisphosphate nucleotidase